MPDDVIFSTGDVLRMLDDLLEHQDGPRWNRFFADRARPCPFLVDRPDENLAGWFADGRLAPGRVLELGCGHGRNAIFLARQGCAVDAVDFSAEALGWAKERAERAGVRIGFQHASIFEATVEDGGYDLVYDSGCFHHIAPHRRRDYVDLVVRALRPGGSFGLVCFRPEGGSGLSDEQVYRERHLAGGLGYAEEQLRFVFDREPLRISELRRMVPPEPGSDRFGEDFLQVLLATKAAGS